MNGRAIPGACLFRLYVYDKEMSWPHHVGETHQPDWVVYVRDSEKFRLTNVIPERIIFVSRGITVQGEGKIWTRYCIRCAMGVTWASLLTVKSLGGFDTVLSGNFHCFGRLQCLHYRGQAIQAGSWMAWPWWRGQCLALPAQWHHHISKVMKLWQHYCENFKAHSVAILLSHNAVRNMFMCCYPVKWLCKCHRGCANLISLSQSLIIEGKRHTKYLR